MTLHQKHYYRLFLIIAATIFYFLANIQRVAIPGAMFNVLQGDFLVSASKITLLGAIFSYVYALTQLVVGLLVDKIGGFRVIAIGCAIFAIGSIIFPHSHSLFGLYISRACVGFGAATFYLSTIREVKKYSQDKNFSLAVSYILFIGYSGGIIANAPFVALVHNTGWRYSLNIIGYFTLFLAIIYLITLFIFKPTHIERETKFSLAPFKEVLSQKRNINLYIFGSINYGLYYVLQSVIGNKFLQDFCHIGLHKSALVLSIMALVSACAGTITAFISRIINNRRSVIFKTFAFLSFFSCLSVCLFLA
ncbi:MFS transporter, partial [bacterium]|nr:MFS transporter [bacterium]